MFGGAVVRCHHYGTACGGRWTIMDGLHRLLKASLLGLEAIGAKQARPRDIPKFSRQWSEPHNHP